MKTLIGIIGATLDSVIGKRRWRKWRPSVSVCMHENLKIDRYILIYQSQFKKLLEVVKSDIEEVSPGTEVIPYCIDFDDPWDFEEVYGKLHDFTHKFEFSPEEEYLINITTGTHVVQICLFLLTESRFLPGKLIQVGRVPRSRDIVGNYSIIDLDLARYDTIASRFDDVLKDDLTFLKSGIATRNSSFNDMIQEIEQVARISEEPVLLTGPTGAGKSHLAKRIYELKVSASLVSGEFVELNCATLRHDSAMSALFGHSKGAFTGAVSERSGALKRADGGILFLDEIAELGLDEQAMLLRAIEDKLFLPLGSDSEVASSFQLICGTNRDMIRAVEEGTFREDLLARIDLWTFSLPSLSERKEDIEPNIDYELERFARRYNRKVSFNNEAFTHFLSFATSPKGIWKSNFRDLSGAVTRMATLAPSGRITVTGVNKEIKTLNSRWSGGVVQSHYPLAEKVLGESMSETIDLFDLPQLESVLQVCCQASSMSQAGRELFSVSREKKKSVNDSDRVRKYLSKFGITAEDIAELKSVYK